MSLSSPASLGFLFSSLRFSQLLFFSKQPARPRLWRRRRAPLATAAGQQRCSVAVPLLSAALPQAQEVAPLQASNEAPVNRMPLYSLLFALSPAHPNPRVVPKQGSFCVDALFRGSAADPSPSVSARSLLHSPMVWMHRSAGQTLRLATLLSSSCQLT